MNFDKGLRDFRNYLSALVLFAATLMSGCARQVAPSGGPVDKIPPKIVSAIPEKNATLVPLQQQIEFEFSEGMNTKSLEKALFITPAPGWNLQIRWKGRRKLRIRLGDALSENRTYIVTLGTDLKDSHGNGLTQSYTLAFSTGDRINNGRIAGRIYDAEKPQGVLIWAYALNEHPEPNPESDLATYITQADQKGAYELSNLSEGSYRIFAIEDKDGNRFFETGGDAIGVAQKDVHLLTDSIAVENINFRVSTRDTLGPALTGVEVENATQVKLKFDEALAAEGAAQVRNYRVVAGGTDSLQIQLAYLSAIDASEVKLITAAHQRGAEYKITVEYLFDLAGNQIDPKFNSDVFSASALPDTFKPQILKISPADSARAIMLTSNIEFYFSEPVQKQAFENSFTTRDTLNNVLAGTFKWLNPATVQFAPAQGLKSLTRYLVKVQLDSIVDLAGNAVRDSLLQHMFTAINVDTLSSIAGTISDLDSTATGGIFLTAAQKRTDGASYDLQLEGPGPYKFADILPGLYSISGFRDVDGNGEYSHGTAFPFQPSERFIIYEDSIKVRARWPNEGNDFSFPALPGQVP